MWFTILMMFSARIIICSSSLVDTAMNRSPIHARVELVENREEVPFLVRFQSEDDPSYIYNGILISPKVALAPGSMNEMRRISVVPPKTKRTFRAILGDLDQNVQEPGEVEFREMTFLGDAIPKRAADDGAFLVVFPHPVQLTERIQPIRVGYNRGPMIASDFSLQPVTLYGWSAGQ
ncbi:unnamed protein product [Notodromas monacha]|uniref:Gingipain propeptide domain-containing protein n=1 Tax=Notodromas monacha TaxID=399045 RepID=A0A7R9GKG9_9CRUS|nr:unnamed protein product [Notodromas monacha]CAG0924732.1 unnamed protein product [Notodromas monacha]